MENKKSSVWMITTIVLGVLIALFLVLTIVVKVTGTASSKSKNPGPAMSVESSSELEDDTTVQDSVYQYEDVNAKKDVDVEALNQSTETGSEEAIGDVDNSEDTEELDNSEDTENTEDVENGGLGESDVQDGI